MGEYLQGSLSDTLEGLKVTVTPVPMAVRLDRTLKGISKSLFVVGVPTIQTQLTS